MNTKKNVKKSGFEAFALKPLVLRGIKEMGFTTPSPIQEQAIPLALEGEDVIAQAQTGTGKTAAFAIPILNQIQKSGEIEALVITPTRELAMQVSDEIFKLGKFLRVKTMCVYGGQSIGRQCELLKNKPQVLVATPGRLLDHLKNERIPNFTPKIVVLDEGDEMLDMGFLDDVEEIFSYLASNRQTLLFSATMPAQIKNLAQRILYQPQHVKITPVNITNTNITQKCYVVNEGHRDEAIVRLIDSLNPPKSIVFTATKREADTLAEHLKKCKHRVSALHGDMEQRQRMTTIRAFREGKINLLVATDVAARGLDISDVSHVFNYHIPFNPESYVHRIGRTGRAGKTGVAITLITPLEFKELKKIQDEVKQSLELEELPVQEESHNKIVQKILHTKINDKAVDIYNELMDKIDEPNAILKILSLMCENDRQSRLGPSQAEIAALQNKNTERRNGKQERGGGLRDRHSSRAPRSRSSRGGYRGRR
ncbi:DEAD/DEAH box helicase [Helicobacter enhydrae]|nr:DEAD/DEAH box helicase [Helicobacter enhydrae]